MLILIDFMSAHASDSAPPFVSRAFSGALGFLRFWRPAPTPSRGVNCTKAAAAFNVRELIELGGRVESVGVADSL